MSVVAVHPSAELYGSDRMFLETVAVMDGPVLAVLPHHGPLADALAERGIPCHILDFPVLRKVALRSPLAAARFAARFLVAIPRLALWLRRNGRELLYVSTVIEPVWMYAGRLAGRRIVCHVHESEPAMPRLVSAALLMPVRLAHTVIANSLATRRWIMDSTGRTTAARVRVVHNGVPEPRGAAPAARPTPARQRLVLVGRLSGRKGQDVAIRAVAMLRERGHDVALALVGDCFPGYEDYVDGLERLVGELGLADSVSFEGFQDPYPYLSGADVALVPSRVEPFGLVAVEALLLGRPTVVSRVGGLPEIITDGATGRLVPPADPAALADAVADLLDDPEGAAALGRRGREEARRRFSSETYARRLRRALTAEA